ncbi:right-handed parallel beta-helix repeat-containing protein [Gimesia sp.]|uniref:right-handed parallel beta-helix repeat-containing protein n=1 Tax=Gimesia sp. TaxID=2024833 RepID=UPI003A8CFCA5
MKSFCIGLLLFFCVPCSLRADSSEILPAPESPDVNGDVSELFGDAGWFRRYQPHFGYRYQAGDTIGRIGGLSSLDGFLPLLEAEDGNWLTFLDARLLLDDQNQNLGSNVGLGARQYLPEWERTIGGYVYYDTRDTGMRNFSQVSGGIETLGDLWDARLNWYVPTGSRRSLVGTSHTLGGPSQFVGHYLYGGILTRYYQAAMTGVDMEAGRKILTSDSMDVRAFAGWYHFQAPGSQQAWGWKTRVENRISDLVALNLGVQNDRVFNTTVNFSVSITWPSITGRRAGLKADIPARDRLGESPERLRSIVVDNQAIQDPNGGLLINPATGNPYYFMHVASGGNSDGSYEDPYATLADAFADPRTQAGEVVVYDHRSDAETGTFTLADQTQVLSSGPTQFLNTQIGQVALPDSNTGLMPQITGNFTLANGSVLSGFNITSAGADPAVMADGVQNITIANNTITNGSTSGIAIANSQGITITKNTLQDVSDDAIDIEDSSGNITISKNTIKSIATAFDDAINVELNGAASLNVDNNIISSVVQTSDNGINVTTTAGDITTRIRNNQITGVDFSLAGGINYTGNSSGFAQTAITDNIILNDDDSVAGSAVFNGIHVSYLNGSAKTDISNNQIATNDHATNGRGIWLNYQTNGATTTTVNDNIISDYTDTDVFAYGLIAEVNQGTKHDFFITNNKIGPNQFNVRVDVTNGAAANMQITQNLFADSVGTSGDLLIYSEDAGSDLSLQIFGNTAHKPFDFTTNAGGIIRIQDLPDLSANNNGVTVNTTGNVVNAP